MARPTKQGLDYYPMDVGFLRDKKVNRLLTEFGASSVVFVLYVLGRVYEDTGYYLKWDEDDVFLAADAIHVKPQYIREVLAGCLKRSLFDNGVFQVFGALTSAGIQRRYIRGCEKRGEIRMAKEYFLLNVELEKDVPPATRAKLCLFGVFGGGNAVNSPGNAVNSPGSTQRKVEQRKVNQSKSEERKGEEKKEKESRVLPAPEARYASPSFRSFTNGNELLLKALMDFEGMRTEHGENLSESVRKLVLGDLKKLSLDADVQIKILNQSVLRKWKSLHPLKEEQDAEYPLAFPRLASPEESARLEQEYLAWERDLKARIENGRNGST